MTNDGGGSGAPRFDVVLRGYDRRQVDEHVARMQRIIGRMRADLELARSQPLPIVQPVAGMPVEHNGARPGPRPRPGESPDVVGSFTDRMQTILQAAEDEAAEIRKKAHTSARSELQAARAEVADLARQRDVMVTELNRLRGQLETILSAPTAKMTPVTRNGTNPSPTRREGKPRPSPKPRAGATPSPVAQQAVTGPQQVPPPPPVAADAAATLAAPAVVDKKASEAASKATPNGGNGNGSARNGADETGKPEDAAPTTAVQVSAGVRGKSTPARRDGEKPAAEPGRPAAGQERPAVDATVRVAAVRPDAERPAEAEAHSSSRSG